MAATCFKTVVVQILPAFFYFGLFMATLSIALPKRKSANFFLTTKQDSIHYKNNVKTVLTIIRPQNIART